MVTRRVPFSTAANVSVVPTGSACRCINRQTWPVSQCTNRIYLPAHILLKPISKFALRTVVVAATTTVSDEQCSLAMIGTIKRKNT